MPFDPTTATPIDGFDASTAEPAFRFSQDAIDKYKGDPNARVVYMSPADYLRLSPPANPNDAKGQSLRESLDRGDEVFAIPTFSVKEGRIAAQDGRHRALEAQKAGLDKIPVAIIGDLTGTTELRGMSGNENISLPALGITPTRRGTMDELSRQAGLTARAAVSGITALPTMVGDAVNSALNLIPGVHLGMPSERVQAAMRAAGVPEPETGGERISQAVGGALAGGGLQIGAARGLNALVSAAIPKQVTNAIASVPGLQAASLTAGSLAQQGAAESGAGPLVQAGAGLGAAMLPGAPAGLANRVRPTSAARADQIRALAKEGVSITPGQLAGGALQRLEDAGTSIPFVGDVIRSAQRTGIESFDRAAINRALTPIGKRLPPSVPVGRDAIDFAHAKLDDAYNDLLPRMRAELDDGLKASLDGIKGLANSGLSKDAASELSRIIDNEVIGKFTPGGRVAGETINEIDSQLGVLIREKMRSDNYDTRKQAAALMEAQSSIRDMMERINPNDAPDLAAVRKGYANLMRAEVAAARQGAKEGVFTPAQYGSAVRQLDPSKRKNKFARGKAFGQDLSDAGQTILSPTVPDSGTTLRMLLSHPLQGALGVASTLPLSALYSQPSLAMIQRMALSEPQNALAGLSSIPYVTPRGRYAKE